jgi:PAS domain S-box-containing protein
MIFEKIVPQSAGSLSVAVLALLMTIMQILVFFRKPQIKWYAWSAAASFAGMVYSIGIFLEYNTLGSVNRFGGVLEFTAIIFLVHCLYGFTFAYLGIDGKRYHILGGTLNCLILILLWSTDSIVGDRFVVRHFIGLANPFIESDLGPLGLWFELYAVLSSIGGLVIWLRHKGPDPKHKIAFLIGMAFWIVLGIHDGLASMGVPAFQYVMEYGFFAFSIAVLWVVFDSYVDLSAEDKYRVITEFANDCILVVQDDKAVFANQTCNLLIGRPAIDSSSADFLDVVVSDDREKLIQYFGGLLNSNEVHNSLMIRIRRGDEERIVEIRASVISYRNRPAVLAVMRDVTERVRKEEALRKSEVRLSRLRKMESLGLLAGGVAHDLNNVLSGIVGYPELILLDLPEDSKLRKPIETMQESGKKAVAIVQELLTVARGAAVTKEPLNLNDVIRQYLESPEYAKLLHYHPAVTVKSDLASDLLNIKGSPVHIGKAVMNLVSNACEAVGEDRRNVVVSTMNRYVDKPLKSYDEVKKGEYAVLAVEDNGSGISSDDLKRIFEPFFTKKVMGRSGTGLGLTLVWNVVQDHEGYIDVVSDGKGTRFELYFPTSREAVPGKKSLVSVEDLCGHGESILIVDDVRSQREILCHMLETLKYKPNAVSGGKEAIDYLKEHRADLLLLDMIMDPGINGRDTYERIKKTHPEQKAIIVSGFAETDHVKETLEMGAGRYLKKPVILEELGRAVKEELEK